ncbi:MAG: hypothetical protein ACXVB1_18485, partial [Pseudobdellovibrionaceae bacterium]
MAVIKFLAVLGLVLGLALGLVGSGVYAMDTTKAATAATKKGQEVKQKALETAEAAGEYTKEQKEEM